jgi:O-succinylbenzoic acid--CoA ligase
MKCLLVGGAPADAALQQELRPLRVPVYLTYGMTETCSHVALRRLNGPEASASFRVLPGIAAGQDERGCLTLRGDVTDDQLIVTNDQVSLLDAHTFEWLGRADFVINSGGVKVPAEKVELVLDVALAEIGESRRCFVAGQPDERLGQAITAFIEGPALAATLEKQLRALLAERLGRYEQPRQFIYLPEFQVTATGKLNRAATLRQAPAAG